ncbi:hypothetical protein PMF13cell1_01912 [Blautia producta]|uniref:Carbohydrate-binding domain-containing protein n=1 Tax=Blautia producta TaxID=33035 RepID=A0A4V0Z7D0_9FIRM|nr:hypothetical protein [Blautia producta]QBE96368.1 hypothetical protein PMF13cell1_01912 [Blautia producta]
MSAAILPAGSPVYAAEAGQDTDTNEDVLQEQQESDQSLTTEQPSEKGGDTGTQAEENPERTQQDGADEEQNGAAVYEVTDEAERTLLEWQQNRMTQRSSSGDLNVDQQDGWTYDGNRKILTFTDSGEYTVTGNATNSDRIVVAQGFEGIITLKDLSIDAKSGAAFKVEASARLTVKLSGVNTLKTSNSSNAGLQFDNADVGYLIVTSAAGDGMTDGSLTAAGGINGAGIGGGANGDFNNFTINGGAITATGGINGAGIGGGSNGSVSNIVINGGMVTARGGTNGAGIGGGSNGKADIITINGGTVEASANNRSGIGGGSNGTAKNVTITGGSIKGTVGGSPKDGNGNYVYRAVLETQPGITSVSVDGTDYKVAGNHENDDAYYLYMSAGGHVITTSANRYLCEYANRQFDITELTENTYTLTIPASLELNTKNQAEVAVSDVCMKFSDIKKQVKVKVSDATDINKDGALSLSQSGGSAKALTVVTNDSSGPVTAGSEILSVPDSSGDSQMIYFGDPALPDGSGTIPAGNYSGTLTFAVSVE